ncbi:hypothetical protein TNCV_373521 [Trichonephila clavipes]|nr:hypothetical protein TNCV_373521 [Trichonephila clavipes]
MDLVILKHGRVVCGNYPVDKWQGNMGSTGVKISLAPPLLTTTPPQREDISDLDRFKVHRCPTRRVFGGTGLETCQP